MQGNYAGAQWRFTMYKAKMQNAKYNRLHKVTYMYVDQIRKKSELHTKPPVTENALLASSVLPTG